VKPKSQALIEEATATALKVLLNNAKGPHKGLPRTAAWGYPEPYTRDLMISALGMLVSDEPKLVDALRRTLEALARNQTQHGHIPSFAHDPEDRGASDTTPLFLFGLGLYRKHTGEDAFLTEAAEKALTWMVYQSPEDRLMVAQQPTSDWRDEQWVPGFSLYVNAVAHAYLQLHGHAGEADVLRSMMNRFTVLSHPHQHHVHGNLVIRRKPYYALWAYKHYVNERFDLLGNSLAILTGLASRSRARKIIAWVEGECVAMRGSGDMVGELPPNLFPFVRRTDPDWKARYDRHNRLGDYHNGGVWPFICGFYVAAMVAAGFHRVAHRKLMNLTELVARSRRTERAFGFNEWIKAQDGRPSGNDWQTWSAAMYLYAVECVERQCTPFFDEMRRRAWKGTAMEEGKDEA